MRDRFNIQENMLRNFLECLLCASEKAALIARACRSEASLFELLVEEKTGDDKNDKRDQVDVEEGLGAAAGDLVVDKESVSSRIIKSVFCLM